MQQSTQSTNVRGLWSSRLTFVFAASGAAVGLGNVWKFPYIAGENGGGAFVFVYLMCIAVIGVPIMMAELLIGRRGQSSPSKSFANIAEAESVSTVWQAVGLFGVLASFLILTFYGVIGGWTIAYLVDAVSNGFSQSNAETVAANYEDLLASGSQLVLWQTAFMVLTITVVAGGLNSGIERSLKVLMPILLVLLGVMLAYTMVLPSFSKAFSFMFNFDFSKLSGDVVLVALGHAFFTLSLGMSSMIAYGSFLPKSVSILKVSLMVSAIDTLVAIVAGLIVFTIVYATKLDPAAGPGLVFQTLPIAFSGMGSVGQIVGIMFFLLLLVAAWSSAISQLEPAVQFIETKFLMSRKASAIASGVVVWIIGVFCALSFNEFSGIELMPGKNLFDFIDYLTASVLLPLVALFVAIFTGWIVSGRSSSDELQLDQRSFSVWRCLIRYIIPVLILGVFIKNLEL